jgi:hypothetical protein
MKLNKLLETADNLKRLKAAKSLLESTDYSTKSIELDVQEKINELRGHTNFTENIGTLLNRDH